MANQRCPICGSYNTGIAYLNYAGKAVRVTAKFLGAVAIGFIAGPGHGAHINHNLQEEEEKKQVRGHICHKCGYEW